MKRYHLLENFTEKKLKITPILEIYKKKKQICKIKYIKIRFLRKNIF